MLDDGIAVSLEVAGLQEAINNLNFLKDRGRVAVARSAMRGGLTVIAKQMRKDLSPKVKDARKDIGVNFKASKTAIILKAKVGFRVGKKSKRLAGSVRTRRKSGVGISGQNIHWWILGTKKRFRNVRRGGGYKMIGGVAQKPISTGTMRAQQPGLAINAFRKVQSKVHAVMAERFEKQLAKEVAKLKR